MIIGPRVRAGFSEPPVIGPAIRTAASERESNGQRRDTRRSPIVRGHGDYYKDEDEGNEYLHQERPKVPYVIRGERRGESSHLSRSFTESDPHGDGTQNRAQELRPDIDRHVLPGELVGRRERQSDRRVHVRPRDVSDSGDYNHQRNPEGQSHGERIVDRPSGGTCKDCRDRDGATGEY
jgi:hypothetical protein